MVAFPRAVIAFCNLIHCFSTFSLTFPSSLLKLSNFEVSIVSYCIALHYRISNFIVLYCTALNHIFSYCIVFHVVLYYTILYHVVLYFILLYCVVSYCIPTREPNCLNAAPLTPDHGYKVHAQHGPHVHGGVEHPKEQLQHVALLLSELIAAEGR